MDKIKGSTIIGGGKKENRQPLDFYPTPKNVTISLMDFLYKQDRIDKQMSVWEPACGIGSMSKVIENYGNTVYSSDINDTGFGSPYMDFIKHTGNSNFDAIITNPPFNQAEQFIIKSLQKSRLVCMLLKNTYWSAAKRQKLFEETKPVYVLPLTWRPDFMEHTRKIGDKKGAPTMDFQWTVWIRGNKQDCKFIPLSKPKVTTV